MVVNRDEAETLSGVDVDGGPSASEAAITLRDRLRVGAVIITLGSAGAVLVDASGVTHSLGHEVAVLDTVGAGDAFAGAVAAAVGRGVELREAVHIGNAAGAMAVGRKGAYDACPTLAETELFTATAPRGKG